jgi:hypothetical protein
VLLVGPDRDDVAWPNLFDRTAPPLVQAAAEGDDERLSEWMRMPVAPRAGLEADVRARRARGLGRLEQWVDANSAGEMLGRRL